MPLTQQRLPGATFNICQGADDKVLSVVEDVILYNLEEFKEGKHPVQETSRAKKLMTFQINGR